MIALFCQDSSSDMTSSQVPQIVGIGTQGFRVYERFLGGTDGRIVPIEQSYFYWFMLGK